MIEEHLYNEDIAGGYKNLAIRQVYECDRYTIFQLEKSEQHELYEDNPINQLVPGTRCYRVGGRTDNVEIARRPKYSDRLMQVLYPVAWIHPKSPHWEGEIYEIGHIGFISGHGEMAEATTNQSVSIYHLRKSRPELSDAFELKEISTTIEKINAPGAHIRPEQMPDAYSNFLTLLKSTLKTTLKNEMFNLSFTYVTHTRVCDMLQIPKRLQEDYRNIIPFVLADETTRKYESLVDELIKSFTIDLFDLRIERTELIAQVCKAWLETTSFHKISHKILADNAVIYNKLVSYEFSQIVVKEVEDTIKEIIKQYEKQ